MSVDQGADRPRPAIDWDQFLATERPDIGYKQHTWWADFLKSRGWDCFGFAASENNRLCGGAKVLVKAFAADKCYYYIPHGPVLPADPADAAELFPAMMAYIDAERRGRGETVSHLRLEPRWTQCPDFLQGFRQSDGWNEPRSTLCVDLTLDEDRLLAQMKPKGRYNIRLAARHQVTVVEDTSRQGLADFLRLYNNTVSRQPMLSHSSEYFENLAETLFPHQRGSIFFAEYQGQRLAAAWVLYCGRTATYQYGGTVLSHRNVMAPYRLHYEVMRKAKSLGLEVYDFYGISPRDKPQADWENFSEFKRKFGGQELNFIPALDYVYDSDAYREYREYCKR